MQNSVVVLVALIGLVCFVFGAFFAIRGYYKFREWHSGEKDDFWTFLAMILGCGSLTICGISIIAAISNSESMLPAISAAIFVGILLGLGAIGLTTYYYFLKWKAAK